MEGEAAEQEAEAEQRGPGGHPGVYPGTWQQQILGARGTGIATITTLAGTERSARTRHLYLQLSGTLNIVHIIQSSSYILANDNTH